MAWNFCCCSGLSSGEIFSSKETPIFRSASTFCRPLSVVFFFSSPSCLISCWRIGTICFFCSSVSPSSIENWFDSAVSGFAAICGAGMIS